MFLSGNVTLKPLQENLFQSKWQIKAANSTENEFYFGLSVSFYNILYADTE